MNKKEIISNDNEDNEYITRKDLEELLDETRKENKLLWIASILCLIFSLIVAIFGVTLWIDDLKCFDIMDETYTAINETCRKVQDFEYKLDKIETLEQKSKYYEEASDIIMDLYNYSNLKDIVKTWGKPISNKS